MCIRILYTEFCRLAIFFGGKIAAIVLQSCAGRVIIIKVQSNYAEAELFESDFDAKYFDAASTLDCGQTFRFEASRGGYIVYSGGRACRLWRRGERTVLRCEEADGAYFAHYFDLARDYAEICGRALSCGIPFVAEAARAGRGIRILNQDAEETIFSFLLSQNNNIPRIRMLIGRICAALGEERSFEGERYFAFPRAEKLAQKGEDFYFSLGCGYRAKYIAAAARILAAESAEGYAALPTEQLREKLLSLPGVGPKVADCVLLFAYHRTESFPVDTWIEKVYREELGGTLKDRKKIAAYFAGLFGEAGGYIQQYIFRYERERRTKWQG